MANYFPEILAMLIFLPTGMFMGFMLNYVRTALNALSAFSDVKCWPFLVGGIVAILTGGIHLAIKQKYKQYKYEHMYFQMVGLIVLLITEGLLIAEYLQSVAFLGFVAHGIIYVSALSYINIRIGQSQHRYLKLSIPHFVYLTGVSLGATLNWVTNDTFSNNDDFFYDENGLEIGCGGCEFDSPRYKGEITGITQMVITIIILCGFLINEALQQCSRSYNYKESLDNDINRENTNKEILENKYFHIIPPHLNFPVNMQLPQIPLKPEALGMKECGRILYVLASKVLALMFFYYPFLYLHSLASVFVIDSDIYNVHWFGTGGVVISLIILTMTSYKINYLLSIAIKIICMVVILIYFSDEYVYWQDIKILFWVVFAGVGFGFSHADINILSYTNLKSNEIVLAIGYFIEHLIIGVLVYETTFNPENIFDLSTSVFNIVFAHALTFILILVGIGMLGIFLIPNGKHSSLLGIKNILNNYANVNQLVNIGNYGGQQQLHWQQQNFPQIAQIQPHVQSMPYNPNSSAYQPPHSHNMFQYGRPDEQSKYPQQQYPQYSQSQFQQMPYINTTYPSQMGNAPNTIPAVAMMPQQNFQNLPQPVAPMMYNSCARPSQPQYNQNISQPIFPSTNPKYSVHT